MSSPSDPRPLLRPYPIARNQSLAAKRRRGRRRRWLLIALVFMIGAGACVSVAWKKFFRSPGSAARTLAERGPEFLLVAKWLSAQYDETSWRDLRWWPAIDCPELDAELIGQLERRRDDARMALESHVDVPVELSTSDVLTEGVSDRRQSGREAKQLALKAAEASLAAQHNAPVPRLCRLQYRTRDSSGQRSQHDDLFEIRGEEVKPLPDDTAEKFRHLFLGSAE